MNILFVLYHNFKSNSAIQVHNFANALVELGHNCIIVVPDNKDTAKTHIGDRILYKPMTYQESIFSVSLFENGTLDIIHAWTPREIVRNHCNNMKRRFPESKLVIDLEDNEENILEAHLRKNMDELRRLPAHVLNKMIPHNLIHPWHYKKFLEEADGATVIMDTLLKFVPDEKPGLVLWPILDTSRFYPREKKQELLDKFGLNEEEIIVSYIGNVHSVNRKEVRSLYLAVALANREGYPAKLIRAGDDYCKFLGEQEAWGRKHSIELGFLPNKEIPEIIALSDVLIQPGKADIFNDYRLPSKLPEFLATGLPVALPDTNLGRFLENGKEAIVLKKGNSLEILEVIKNVRKQRELMKNIGQSGRQFALDHFDKAKIAKKLAGFYEELLN